MNEKDELARSIDDAVPPEPGGDKPLTASQLARIDDYLRRQYGAALEDGEDGARWIIFRVTAKQIGPDGTFVCIAREPDPEEVKEMARAPIPGAQEYRRWWGEPIAISNALQNPALCGLPGQSYRVSRHTFDSVHPGDRCVVIDGVVYMLVEIAREP
jgi:hypothetical protein